MPRALTQLLPEDHRSIEKRSCKRRDNNERPKYQNVRVSFSSVSFFFDSVLAVGRAAHCRSGWGVLSLVLSTTEMAERSSRCDPDAHADTYAYRDPTASPASSSSPHSAAAALTLLEFFVPEHRTAAGAKSAVTNQEATIAQVKSAIAEQIEAVTARLKEHDLQIQKVSVGSTTYLDEGNGVFENRFNHECTPMDTNQEVCIRAYSCALVVRNLC
jgi:hypothetical protein